MFKKRNNIVNLNVSFSVYEFVYKSVVVIVVVGEAVIPSLTLMWPSQQGTHVGHHEHEATQRRLWKEQHKAISLK